MRIKALGACLFVLALLPSAYLGWHYRDMPHLGFYHDDALYWVSAKSLAQGDGYRILSLPGQPYQTKYPPLYPLMLSLIWRIDSTFPRNLGAAMALCWIMLPALLWLSLRLYRLLGLKPAHAWFLTLVLALNPLITVLSLTMLSELTFMCLVASAVLLAERAGQKDAKWTWALAAGLMAGAAYLTRTAGLPLLVTIPAGLLVLRRVRAAAVVVAAMLPAVAAWNVWMTSNLPVNADATLMYYTDYAGFRRISMQWMDLPLVVWRNFDTLISSIGDILFFRVSSFPWGVTAGRVLAVAAIAGVVRLVLRSRKLQFGLFAGAYLSLLLVWHYQPVDRFVMPALPLLLAGLFVEFERVALAVRRSLQSSGGAAKAATLGMAGLLGICLSALLVQTILGTVRFWPAAFDQRRQVNIERQKAYRWIAGHLPANARLLSNEDPLVYLYSGRQAVKSVIPPMLFYRFDEPGLERHLRSCGGTLARHLVGYWLSSTSDWRYEFTASGRQRIQSVLRESLPHELVYRSETISVLRLKSESTLIDTRTATDRLRYVAISALGPTPTSAAHDR